MNEHDRLDDSTLLREEIPHEVAERLGYYVYLYVHPDTKQVFYVGKGMGQRALSHLSHEAETEKVRTIRALLAEGKRPRIDILAHGLESEDVAHRIESAAIDLLGLDRLTNLVRGHDASTFGRMPLDEIRARYGAPPVEIEHPSILIRVNRLFRPGMTPEEILEITRGIWKIGRRRETVHYAMAVYHGVIREVFEIEKWHPAGTTPYATRTLNPENLAGRYEFTGRIAPEPVRSMYLGRRVSQYLSDHSQNPIAYVGGSVKSGRYDGDVLSAQRHRSARRCVSSTDENHRRPSGRPGSARRSPHPPA